jgi:hypothetical protein
MSIEDRVRAATRARTDLVRDISPLKFPEELTERARRPRLASRWSGWLIPVTAAVAVIVIAAILVAVRDLPGLGHASGPAPADHSSGVAGLPRYGVVLTKTTAKIAPKWGSASVETANLAVIDTQTGKQVTVIKHPDGVGFDAVSGAADDRTFVVAAGTYNLQQVPGTDRIEDVRLYYLLRIAPGTAHPYTLTRLSIPVEPGEALVDGLALSPDGRTLAILDWCTVPGACYTGSPGTLRLFSVATGKAVRTWTWGKPPAGVPGSSVNPVPVYGDSTNSSENSAGLTWLADRQSLAFTYYAKGRAPEIRTLDTTRPGGDLVTHSQHIFTLPASGPDACAEAQLTPDGRTVVCGTKPLSNLNCGPGHNEALEIYAYSAATGKRQGVLYRYAGQCTADGVGALGWVGAGNTVVVMVATGTLNQERLPFYAKTVIGVLAHGKLVQLVPATAPYDQGPGTIAF